MSGDAEALTRKAEPFLGGCLNADCVNLNTEGVGKVAAHGLDVGSQFGCLGNNGGIDIPNLISHLSYAFGYLSRQYQTVGTRIGGIAVRE